MNKSKRRKNVKSNPPKDGVVHPFYPDYIGIAEGRVYSKLVKRYLRGCIGSSGYPQLCLKSADGSLKWVALHRFIADCFLPKEENKPFVHHKNSNRQDARVCNLERVDQRTNMRYASEAGRMARKKGPNHPKFGTRLSEETRQRMSESKMGLKNSRCRGPYRLNGHTADTLKGLADLTGKRLSEIQRLNRSGYLKPRISSKQRRLAAIAEQEQKSTLSI